MTIAEIRRGQIYTIDCKFDLREQELPIILIITLMANIVSVLGLFNMPTKESTINQMMVKILAVSDLVTTVFILAQWVANVSNCRVFGGQLGCTITGWITSTLVIWSAAVVTTMNLCRYMSVSKPIFYRHSVTKKKILISLCGSFVWILFEMSLPLYGIAGPFRFYAGNKICSYDFSAGNYGMFHRVTVGFLGAYGIGTIIIVIYCNISIVYQVNQRSRTTAAVAGAYTI
ncbi:unnamed protein product [Owenia fusiformis]|uniref:G-protein coupled receptors family 1 profile domain-containing protein n=1 Tax=Owenia fusiformis TaxID=6347 RepID=A0A8S4NXI5_OWEFU|nr:unnamed protein product [Owenia fusiformis]